jgi:hypothetical protein
MSKTQTLQKEVVRLPKRVAGRIENFELPVGKRKAPDRTKQIGAALGALVVVTSALYVGRTVRRAIRRRQD